MRSGHFEIATSRDLGAVEADWEALERDGLSTPFQTRAWLLPFYRILAPAVGAKPLFVVVRDLASARPLMFLPLCVCRRFGVRVVEFADLGVSDYNAPIFARDFDPSQQQWKKLWSDIVSCLRDGSVMRLSKLPSRIEGRLNPLALAEHASEMPVGSWGVELPDRLEVYDDRALTRTFSKELAKKTRRVAKRGDIEFAIAATPGERRGVFEVLARQRQARCDEMGRSNILANPAYRDFYEAVATDEFSSRTTSLSALKVGGEIVAAMFALRHGRAHCVIMTTFEGGDWKSCSLGNVLIHEAIERLIGEGVGYFDLTIGDEAYKRDFGASRNSLYASMQPLTAVGVSVSFALKWVFEARRRLKPITPMAEPRRG